MKTPSSLKVDNLRHLSDHGLAVQFSDPKLTALVDYLKSRDQGKTVLSAGKSTLTLTRFGKITVTEAFFSHGSYRKNSIHYLDGTLKFTVLEQGGNDAENTYRTLRAILFGEALPHIWRVRSGADKDALRTWLLNNQWCLNGEAGLRAKAIETAEKFIRDRISTVKSAINYSEHEASRYEAETPERFGAQRELLRENCQNKLAKLDEKTKQAETDLQTLAEPITSAALVLSAVGSRYGARNPYGYDERGRYCTLSLRFPAIGEAVTPPVKLPNYTASVSGETITFSSGIVCPFTYSALRSWLKGEGEAPRTSYGKVEKIETSDANRQPKILLRCGCHYIDAETAVPELAEFLRPSFAVAYTPTRAEVSIDEPELFAARCAEEIKKALKEWKEERENVLTSYATQRHELAKRENDLPGYIEKAKADVERLKADLAKLETQQTAERVIGANLERVRENLTATFAALAFNGGF